MSVLHVAPELIRSLFIALALGLLVGVERERAQAAVGGIRTFPLVACLGCLVALLSRGLGAWLLGAGLLGVASLAVVGHAAKTRVPGSDPGITTEVAVLFMYIAGALVALGEPQLPIVASGTAALLLHWKAPLHEFVKRLGEEDLAAGTRFVLVALVVLPILPDRPMGPYGALNLWNVWFVVVLIVGVGLASYVAYTLAGARLGLLLAGLLGGLVSSTATAVSYAKRAAVHPAESAMCAGVIAVASAVVFVRVASEVAVVAPALLSSLWLPLGSVFGAAVLGGIALHWRARGGAALAKLGNPAELGPAIAFAAVYSVIQVAIRFASEWFGDGGVLALAALAGLTDVDAIVLSTAKLAAEGNLDADLAWRAIVLSATANLSFKLAVVAALGTRSLRRSLAAALVPGVVIGALLVWFWPSPGVA